MSEQPPEPNGPPPWQPPPPYGQQPQGYPVPVAPGTSGKATAALILGIFGVAVCPLVLSVPAIIVGQSAKKEIDASQGRLGGRGQAQAGFILGIVGTVLAGLAALFVVAVFALGSTVEDAFEETCSSVDQYASEAC
jgi:hypothetical protein